MPNAEPGLSEHVADRLADAEREGVEVDGPSPAEDTAGHGTAPGEKPDAGGWSLALRFTTPDGGTMTVTGNGPTPDAAAQDALRRLDESSRESSA